MKLIASTAVVLAMVSLSLTIAMAQTTPRASKPAAFSALPADAQAPFGALAISPTRLVFTPQSPAGQVTLYNSGTAPLSYRITLVELEAQPDGGYGELANGAATPAWSAAAAIRYSPRQVTLQPGQRQVVRLMARPGRDGPGEERRSHLRFSSIPLVASNDGAKPSMPSGDAINVTANLEYRITIPLILRSGMGGGGSMLEQPRIGADPVTGKQVLNVVLRRTGSWADFGAIRAYDSAGREVGLLRGISVLPPLTARRLRFDVTGLPTRIVFASEERGGAIFAETQLN
jgi:fimbrial chaperone protein